MPKSSLRVPHTLGQEEAIERLKNFLPRVKQQFAEQVTNLEEAWEAHVMRFSFTTFGFAIRGQMAVEHAEVIFDGDLPFAAMMFKGKIEKSIRDELDTLLS